MKVKKWTGKEIVSIDEILEMLNEINKLDLDFMKQLTLTRFKCNTDIANHETVQAHCYGDGSMDNPLAGFLGVLNGLIGIDKNHYGPITIDINDDGYIKVFKLTDTDKITKEIAE